MVATAGPLWQKTIVARCQNRELLSASRRFAGVNRKLSVEGPARHQDDRRPDPAYVQRLMQLLAVLATRDLD